MTCGVSPFATTKKALGFPFYSNTDSGDYHVPGVALNSCVQQLFSAKAESVFVLFFYEIQNKKQQTDFSSAVLREFKAGWLWRMLGVGEQSPGSASLGQGDPRVPVKSNKGWARNGTRNTASPGWRHSCPSACRDFSLSLFC